MNIHGGTVYPDLTNMSKYLRSEHEKPFKSPSNINSKLGNPLVEETEYQEEFENRDPKETRHSSESNESEKILRPEESADLPVTEQDGRSIEVDQTVLSNTQKRFLKKHLTKVELKEFQNVYEDEYEHNKSRGVLRDILKRKGLRLKVRSSILNTVYQQTYFCSGTGANGQGTPVDRGFVIFEGAHFRGSVTKSLPQNIIELRKELMDEGKLKEENPIFNLLGVHYVLTENTFFSSPSTAAACLLGRSANGWVEWKTKDRRTLDEMERR